MIKLITKSAQLVNKNLGPTIDVLQFKDRSIQMNGLKIGGKYAALLFDGRQAGYSSPSVGSVYLSQAKGTRVVVSDHSSKDLFRAILKTSDLNERIHRVFPLREGWLVQFGSEDLETVFIDQSGAVTELTGPKYAWHGTFGVAVNSIGTVLFNEYQAGSKALVEIGVWRLTAGGLQRTLRAKAADGIGEIRHFHTVFPDPFEVGTWFASSGDVGSQNRFWVSLDDGQTWKEPKLNVTGLPGNNLDHRRALRFTSARVIDKGQILWVTDDNLGTKYSWSCLAQVDSLSNTIHINVVDALSENLARSLITAGEEHFFITESKLNSSFVEFGTLDNQGRILDYSRFQNHSNKSSPVTTSFSSSEFIDQTAFFRHGGTLDNIYAGTVIAQIT